MGIFFLVLFLVLYNLKLVGHLRYDFFQSCDVVLMFTVILMLSWLYVDTVWNYCTVLSLWFVQHHWILWCNRWCAIGLQFFKLYFWSIWLLLFVTFTFHSCEWENCSFFYHLYYCIIICHLDFVQLWSSLCSRSIVQLTLRVIKLFTTTDSYTNWLYSLVYF